MVRPDEEREGRIRALLRFINEECHGETTVAEIYRFAIRNWGYKFRQVTVMSYLQTLILAGEVIINDNHVKVVAKKHEPNK
jgi:hypothetical protein